MAEYNQRIRKIATAKHDYEGRESSYKKLAAAIILQAVRDYRRAACNRKNAEDSYTIESIERFFRSRWFSILSDMDGEQCLKQLQQEKFRKNENRNKVRYSNFSLNMSKRD